MEEDPSCYVVFRPPNSQVKSLNDEMVEQRPFPSVTARYLDGLSDDERYLTDVTNQEVCMASCSQIASACLFFKQFSGR
jgi:hypothetical protein